jgi:hypothetical protein
MARAQPPPKLVPLDASGLITYYVAEGIPTFGSRAGDIELATWAFQEWERSAGGAIRLEPIADEGMALIRLYWLSWAVRKYGETRPEIANRRRAVLVFVRPDTFAKHKTLGPAAAKDSLLRDTIVYMTCLHEIGHALGLGHSAVEDDVMRTEGSVPNFERNRQTLKTRADIASVSWLSGADTLRVRELYKKER